MNQDTRYHYSVLIRWSDEDGVFIADVPELPGCRTHGATYQEAAEKVQEVMVLWIESETLAGRPIPQPRVLATVS